MALRQCGCGRCVVQARRRGGGYLCLHTALDDHTRLAYTETLSDEKAGTCAAFLRRAQAWFTYHQPYPTATALTDNLDWYNHRPHTALSGHPPAHRATNLPEQQHT